MTLVRPRVDNVLINNGVHPYALGASGVFLAGTQGSRIFIATHIATPLAGGVASALNAQWMVASKCNLVGMFGNIALNIVWSVGWVTTTITIMKNTITKKERRGF